MDPKNALENDGQLYKQLKMLAWSEREVRMLGSSTSTCLLFIETVESSITGDVTQLPPTAVWIFYMAI